MQFWKRIHFSYFFVGSSFKSKNLEYLKNSLFWNLNRQTPNHEEFKKNTILIKNYVRIITVSMF